MPIEQILKADDQTNSVDIWSCGVIFLEFLTSRHIIFKNMRYKTPRGEPVEYFFGYFYELALLFGQEEVQRIISKCRIQLLFTNFCLEFEVTWPKDIPNKSDWKKIITR